MSDNVEVLSSTPEKQIKDLVTPKNIPRTENRRSQFTPEDDLIIIREVFSSRAHVAEYGKKQGLFTQAAGCASANSAFTKKVTWKSVRDRYELLQNAFDKRDAANQLTSGVGGEGLTEIEDLLSQMREAKRSFVQKKDKAKRENEEREREKERRGEEIVRLSTERIGRKRQASEEGVDVDAEYEGSERIGTPPKKHCAATPRHAMLGELESFGEALNKSETLRLSLEKEKLSCERKKWQESRKDREEESRFRLQQSEKQQQMFAKQMELVQTVVSALIQLKK